MIRRRHCAGMESSEGCGGCAMGTENEDSRYDDDVIYCTLWEDYHDDNDVCEEWERKEE